MTNQKCCKWEGHHCTEHCDNRANIVAHENKSKYRLVNDLSHKICKIRVDGCLFDSTKQKCDFMMFDCDSDLVVLIELKSNLTTHAFAQLNATIKLLEKELIGKRIITRIVATRNGTPKAFNSAARVTLEKKFGLLIRSTGTFEEKLSTL